MNLFDSLLILIAVIVGAAINPISDWFSSRINPDV